MNFINKIIYKLLSIEESILKHNLSKTLGVKNFSKKKKHYFNGCTVELNSLANSEKEKLEKDITQILNTYDYDPKKLLNYIKAEGTKIIYTNKASKILVPIHENEGFIYPARGNKALYLSLAIEQKIKLKTEAMFILSKGNINKYYFLYHFYNWYAFKHNISGIDNETQSLLNKYLYENTDTKNLQLSDIYKLKDAIQQDKAAIEFVIKLCRNYEGTKQALTKMKKEGSANL